MKTLKFVLFSVMLLVGLFSSGCVVTAFTGNPLPAGVEVTNNLKGKTIVLSTTRNSGPMATLKTGETYHVGVSGLLPGSSFTIIAKVYDQSGQYLGVVENRTGIWFDSGGRFNTTWIVDYYEPARSR